MINKAYEGCNPRKLKNTLDDYLKHNNINILTKRKRVIAWLVCASRCGCKVTRFDAEHAGDHCLNTSISEIGNIDGIRVSRRETKRPTRFGEETNCKEYWLEPNQVVIAENLLGINKAA